MTEKNIFVNKLFLSLNISDFSLFFLCKNCYPSKKLSSCQVPPFLKIWSEAQPPPPPPSRKGEGVHTMLVSIKCYNLHSFTERVILLCDVSMLYQVSMKRDEYHIYVLALFTIPLTIA